MKICFLSHSGQRGGAQTVLLETIDVMRENGVDCRVILPESGPLLFDLKNNGVEAAIIPFPLWMSLSNKTSRLGGLKVVLKNLRATFQARRLALRWGCDVVYTNTVTVLAGAMLARTLRVPHVWHIHEFGYEDHGLVFDLGERLSHFVLQKFSDVCIVHSQAVASKYSRHIGSSKIKVLSMSMHRSFASASLPDDGPCQRALPRRERHRCVIVGNLSRSKGQEDAINAIGELARRGVKIELLVAGEEWPVAYKDQLVTICRSKGLEGLIHFIGHVKDPLSLLLSVDMALMCSRSEAFGRVTIEAMLAGKPVIGARSGATPELIKDGFNGLLYTLGDPASLAERIQYLCEHQEVAQRMGSNGKKWAETAFTKTRYWSELSDVLASLTQSV